MITNKNTSRTHKIVAPVTIEHHVKCIWKPLSYTALDAVGCRLKQGNNQPTKTGALSRTNPPTQKLPCPLPPPLSGQGTLGQKTPYKALEPVSLKQFLMTTRLVLRGSEASTVQAADQGRMVEVVEEVEAENTVGQYYWHPCCCAYTFTFHCGPSC